MSNKFIIKRNDTSPVLDARLTSETLTAVQLLGATVVFNMRNNVSGAVVINRAPVTVVDANAGLVRYEWDEGDTSQVGQHVAEFEVTFADGRVETFPKSDKAASNFIAIVVTEDVA
jgi:hypothetical protein